MKLYHIKDEYIAFLRSYDANVATNKNETRPYIGIVLYIDGFSYYAPLTSPKPKHAKMKNGKDFRKIQNGEYGAINFSNMIPVVDSALSLIDINGLADEKYKRLLQNQYKALKADSDAIKATAKKLRKLILTSDEKLTPYDLIIKKRCCDLANLEAVCKEYIDKAHTDK